MVCVCKKCGKEGLELEFIKQNKSWCKACFAAYTNKRYHAKYRQELVSKRRTANQLLKRLPVVLSETDRAYAAGLIDGEGCVRLNSRHRPARVGQYTLVVEVTNTDQKMTVWLQEQFGGSVSYLPENTGSNRKERWHWRCGSNKALYCLDAIWPYTRTKRQQVKLGRRFQRYVQYTGRAKSPKSEALQQRFYDEFRRFNKRGLR